MSALTYADLCWASSTSREAARADLRTLTLLGEYCAADHRAWLEAQIAQHRERADRFLQASREAYLRERDHA